MTAHGTDAADRAATVLIVGATSGIAAAIARRFARDGYLRRPVNLVLAGRDVAETERAAADLRVRGAVGASVVRFDALDFDGLPALFRDATTRFPGGLTGVVVCHGMLTEQADAQADPAVARRVIDVNFTSAALLLDLAAAHFESRRATPDPRDARPFLCAISSVAGDRGRQSNYAYGAAKAGLSAYLQGLRNRLSRAGVTVTTVKPGFVDTAMTRGRINPNSPLTATPDRVAADVHRAIERGRGVVYTPWFWRGIMSVLCAIPEPVFKRMRL